MWGPGRPPPLGQAPAQLCQLEGDRLRAEHDGARAIRTEQGLLSASLLTIICLHWLCSPGRERNAAARQAAESTSWSSFGHGQGGASGAPAHDSEEPAHDTEHRALQETLGAHM